MKDHLYCEDLYAPLEGDDGKTKDISDDEWKKLDQLTEKSSSFGNG